MTAPAGAATVSLMPETTTTWRLGPTARKTVLTIHIAASVGLLGTTSGTLLLAATAATTGDAAFADAIYRLASAFTVTFGIPLSLLALVSGIAIGAGTRWGVLRYWWTTAKLLLIVGVMANGALNIGMTVDGLRQGDGSEARLIVGTAASVGMLLVATALSTFKPGPRRRAA